MCVVLKSVACDVESHRCVSVSDAFSWSLLWTSKEVTKESTNREYSYCIKPTRRMQTLISAIFSVMLCSCTLPTQPDLLVSSLRCSPSAFDSFRTNAEVRYTLAKPATVSIYIARRDASGGLQLVNILAENIYETKGSHGHTWLGETSAGFFAESGLYIAILRIEGNQYETTVRIFHF